MKILAFFLISPGSRYIRKEIKEKTKMNNVPLDKVLIKLLNLKILKQEKNLIMLNQEYGNKDVIDKVKKEMNQLNLPLNIYYLLTDVSNKLSEIKYLKKVILFGSYAKLVYHEKSDIDLAVIFEEKIKDKKNTEKKVEKIISKIGEKYNQKIEPHFFIESDIKHKEDFLIKDILRNGKELI